MPGSLVNCWENEKLRSELENMRFEKEHLERFPDSPEVDIYADQIGLAQVGGDFFDYFRIDADHIFSVVNPESENIAKRFFLKDMKISEIYTAVSVFCKPFLQKGGCGRNPGPK